jgi:hypothetical protein
MSIIIIIIIIISTPFLFSGVPPNSETSNNYLILTYTKNVSSKMYTVYNGIYIKR